MGWGEGKEREGGVDGMVRMVWKGGEGNSEGKGRDFKGEMGEGRKEGRKNGYLPVIFFDSS